MSNVSSPSDSDNDRRKSPHPPNPPLFRREKTRKRKKALPPQETIDKIWSRFSEKKFSKATVVLPSSVRKAIEPSIHESEQNNLLVSEDYDRAVKECRARVTKLIRECKRVNMRYRDPDFDIDWDLKWEKGYCLNGLGESRFEINGRAFANPTSNVPKAVKRVHEIFDKPTFLGKKAAPADVKQGNLGNCWLMASLTALANMEDGINRICVEYDTKIGIYGFVFHQDGQWIISIIDDKLYLKSPDWDSPSVQRHLLEQTDREDVENEYRKTYQTGSQSLYFAQCRDQNETWLPLLEKAYAKAHGDYASLAGGWIGEGVEDLTGGVTTELLTSDILDADEFWKNEILNVNTEFLFGCSTGLLDGGYGNRDGISEGHAYVVMEARELSTGQRLLKLRNPWGKGKKGNWEGPWSDGSKEFTPEVQKELNHKFGNDSVFWISYQDLLRKYQHFDRTRLFMDDPQWHITQKWISVEVPWRAEFEQKFRIVLKKESPVVLVLSQLDDRYFDGLQGQYSFRLQFRLHEVESPGEEDYIVRSHGNYLMERSVVTELKSLKAGIYSVFLMVIANRNISRPSVEDVIKSECRGRADNEKLARVGMSYGLAHSKGAAYMESKSAAQKVRDMTKARKSRIATRKENWEKRHLDRNILRKQDKKNQEKRMRKHNENEIKAKNKEAKEPKDKAIQTDEHVNVIISEDKGIQTEESRVPSNESKQPRIPQPPESLSSPPKNNDKAIQTIETHPSFSDSQDSPETLKSSLPESFPHPHSLTIPIYPRGRSLPAGEFWAHQGPRNSPRVNISGPQYVDSDGESSASPSSDLDDVFGADDRNSKPIPIDVPETTTPSVNKGKNKESDDEDEPEPWNAVCIVGFRVYSQDPGLELRVFEVDLEEEEVGKGDGATLGGDEVGMDADIEDGVEDAVVKEEKVEVENEGAKSTEKGGVDLPIRIAKQEAGLGFRAWEDTGDDVGE